MEYHTVFGLPGTKMDRSDTEQNYKDGKYHGLYTKWYENGQKEWKWNYEDGLEHGFSIAWDKDGQRRYKLKYRYGEFVY